MEQPNKNSAADRQKPASLKRDRLLLIAPVARCRAGREVSAKGPSRPAPFFTHSSSEVLHHAEAAESSRHHADPRHPRALLRMSGRLGQGRPGMRYQKLPFLALPNRERPEAQRKGRVRSQENESPYRRRFNAKEYASGIGASSPLKRLSNDRVLCRSDEGAR